jgi:hypothetical protein
VPVLENAGVIVSAPENVGKKFEGRGRSRQQKKTICPQITSKVKLTLGKSFLFL